MKTKRYLVIDLEATCKSPRDPSFVMETIEIGAVVYEPGAGTLDSFQAFVRPILNTQLTEFCTQLTSIEQYQVDGAEIFPCVLESLVEFADRYLPMTFGSWGFYDCKQISQDCRLHGVSVPWFLDVDNHLNIKNFFAERRHEKRCGVAKALRRLNLPFEGTHHRALDDAKNISKLLSTVL